MLFDILAYILQSKTIKKDTLSLPRILLLVRPQNITTKVIHIISRRRIIADHIRNKSIIFWCRGSSVSTTYHCCCFPYDLRIMPCMRIKTWRPKIVLFNFTIPRFCRGARYQTICIRSDCATVKVLTYIRCTRLLKVVRFYHLLGVLLSNGCQDWTIS